MSAFQLLLLGPVRLIGPHGLETPGLGVKAKAALAYVATQPNREAGRERLAGMLWDTDDSRHAFRQALLVLRRRLGETAASAVEADAGAVRLGRDVETDLDGFEVELAAGRGEAACALWRGKFCEGLDAGGAGFEHWLAQERARLDERAALAFAELARGAETEGRIELAVAAARRLVELDPFDDAAQARLIGLYRRRGWTGAARLAHRRCVALFHRDLGIPPGPEVQAAVRAPFVPTQIAPVQAAPAARKRGWVGWTAAGMTALAVAGVLAGARAWLAPEPAAASAAWVGAAEWRPDARADTGGVPLAEAIARGLAGDPEFAHLVPGGC